MMCTLLSLLAGGCGDTAVREELGSAGKEQVVIRIAWWGGEERSERTNQALELYTQSHPEIRFETLDSEWADYFQKISREAAMGNMPDIV